MENLGIDGKLLLAQLINFGLFFILFKKYIARPFFTFLSQEKEKEKEKEDLLAKLKKGEEELFIKENEMKKKLQKEEEEMVEKAKKEAALIREELIREANKEKETIIAKGKKQIEEERQKLNKTVKHTVGELSIFLVNQALHDYLDVESKKKLTTYILKNLSKAISSHEN